MEALLCFCSVHHHVIFLNLHFTLVVLSFSSSDYAKLVKRQKQQQIQGQDPEQQSLVPLTEASTSNEIPATTFTDSPTEVGALVVHGAGQSLPPAGPNVLDYTVGSGPAQVLARSSSEHPIDSSGMDDDTIMS